MNDMHREYTENAQKKKKKMMKMKMEMMNAAEKMREFQRGCGLCEKL